MNRHNKKNAYLIKNKCFFEVKIVYEPHIRQSSSSLFLDCSNICFNSAGVRGSTASAGLFWVFAPAARAEEVAATASTSTTD